MVRFKMALVAATMLLGGHPALAWTQYDAGVADLAAQGDALSQQMAQLQHTITEGAMNDPQVAAAYQQYQAQGGTQDYATWAYNYRGTMGYDPRYVQQVQGQIADNNAAEQYAYQDYLNAQDGRIQAQNQFMDGSAANAYQAGMQLGGWRYHQNQDGSYTWYRP